MDTLDNMRTFLAVVKAGSFSAAARALDTVPSVVAKRVNQLEHIMKAPLFHRSTRKLELTAVGHRCRDRFLSIVTEVDHAFTDIAGSGSRLEERLRIKCPTTLTIIHFGDLLARFQAAHPGIRLELVLLDRSVNPLEEAFDVAIGALPTSYANVADIMLCPLPRTVIAAPGYLERAGTPAHPRDLLDHACLSFLATGTNWQFQTQSELLTIDVPGNFSVNDSHVLLRAVEKEKLALALKGGSETIRDLFFKNLSERAGKMLREDIEALGPVRLKDVEEAQATIVATAKDLAASGQIMLSDGREEELVY